MSAGALWHSTTSHNRHMAYYSERMRRQAVDSESIASIGYTASRCELDIEFRQSGDVYRYFGVSADEHAAFMTAESKGGF